MPARWAIASSRSGPTRAKTAVAASLSETVIIRRSSAAVPPSSGALLGGEALQLGREDQRLDDARRLEELVLVATVDGAVGPDDRERDPAVALAGPAAGAADPGMAPLRRPMLPAVPLLAGPLARPLRLTLGDRRGLGRRRLIAGARTPFPPTPAPPRSPRPPAEGGSLVPSAARARLLLGRRGRQVVGVGLAVEIAVADGVEDVAGELAPSAGLSGTAVIITVTSSPSSSSS